MTVKLPKDWVVKYYAYTDWPVIKSSGIELDCAGATREQAEAIAALLNSDAAPVEKTCGACGAEVGERCRTRSDDQCDAGKHTPTPQPSPTSEPEARDIEALAIEFERKIGQSPNRIRTDKTSWGWRYRRAAVQHEFMLFRKFTTPASPAVPAGYKLVPIEPTEAMDAAARAECVRMSGVIDPVVHVWDAMLAAAPQPTDTTKDA
jgi:hypothetical protein